MTLPVLSISERAFLKKTRKDEEDMDRIYFNADKHHLEAIVHKTAEFARQGETAGEALLNNLADSGLHRPNYNGIVDVYCGKLSPEAIKGEVLSLLREKGLLALAPYKEYVQTHGNLKREGHYILHKLSDSTIMTLRILENEKLFVHAHPGRYSPNTFRVKAITFKTAIFAYFLRSCRQCPSSDLELINEARQRLGLSPVADTPSSMPSAIYEVLEKLKVFAS